MREIELNRKTRETEISLCMSLDAEGEGDISTGIGFFDHMLTAFSVHSGIGLTLSAVGDLQVDCHHTIEDTGILIGKALRSLLLEDSPPIERYGSAFIPMDEALGFCSLDVSGRGYLVFDASFHNPSVGGFDCCMAEEFFRAVAINGGITLHLRAISGANDHHILEALFKAFAHALRSAARPRDGGLLTTKGVLDT